MKKYRVFLIFALLAINVRLFSVNDIYFSRFGIEHGLSQLSVISIYQDESGSLWFGTREGVNRFNGNSVEVFLPDPSDNNSLTGNVVRKIYGDKNGHVYILNQNSVNLYDLRSGKMELLLTSGIETIYYGINKLWVASDNTLSFYSEGKLQEYLALPDKNQEIKTILQTTDQRIFAGTVSHLFEIDQNKKIRAVLSNCSRVSSIFEDSKKNIWAGTWQNGLYKIERNGNIRNYVPSALNIRGSISSNFVRAICEDNNGNIWTGTKKGLDRLNVDNDVFTHYGADENNFRQLSNESVWSLLKDGQGTIWAGTYFGGVNYFNPEVDFYTFHDLRNGIFRNRPFPVISKIVEDKNGNFFLCTEGDGLIYYNPLSGNYINYNSDIQNKGQLPVDNIKTAMYDAQSDELWLGMHLGGVCRFSVSAGKCTGHITPPSKYQQSDIVRAIVPYEQNLLLATYNGLYLLDKSNLSIKLFSEKLHEKASYFTDFKIDAEGKFWLAGDGVICYNPSTSEYTQYLNKPNDTTSLSNNNVTAILIDSKNRVWIATSGGGVNQFIPESKTFNRINRTTAHLSNDYVSNLMETAFGYIMIATSKGFSLLDPETGKIRNFGNENGMPLNSLYNGGMCVSKNNLLYVAGMNGMISFSENRLLTPRNKFNLHLVNLWVNNRLVKPGDDTGILKLALPYTSTLKIGHKHRMVTFEFASNNYIKANQVNYRYQLIGSSDEWTELPQGISKLNFMNLPPGKYKLNIQGISPEDGEVMAFTDLSMRVFPPFYNAWYAWIFYILLITFVIWRYMIFNQSKLLLKTSLEYEKKEKAHIEEVNQSKLRFFTNISHEFRTPLTLISGQADMLLQMQNMQPTVYNRILNIKRNTLTMQHLISELLEFRKTEQGHLQLKISENDMVHFLSEIFLTFREYAGYRNINFYFECAAPEIKLWFDPVQMQKVFYNLISNAFKYTKAGGSIVLKIEELFSEVIIKVTDTGSGISADAIDKIFDRFYQAENGLNISSAVPGTGIGLALTKSIVELHSAKINVESTHNAGSSFIVTMKKGSAHFSDDCKFFPSSENKSENLMLDVPDLDFMQEVLNSQLKNNEKQYSMLIVEDNPELLRMLAGIFEPIYQVHTAIDGEEGYEKTMELQPDIVLSDLMMPKMSGSEMCSKIKNNIMVCHIPVVLLTAQTAVEFSIEGLRLGADDYITKPFNVKTLIIRCNNLVNNRKMLQEKFTNQAGTSVRIIATNQLDLEFIEKEQRIVEEHVQDSEFDVPAFSREMALGRTKLFMKIKGITGQTPNDFILGVRLKKAARLLNENPEYNISDITYMLGFNSPKYFAKCFKEQFGISPTAYRKSGEPEDENDENVLNNQQ